MPSGVLQSGHRRRGAGLVLDQIPELERAILLSRHKGRTVYVDSAVSSSGNGDSWSGAYDTLEEAVDAALADDMILVAPGHAETITSMSISKARVSIIGLGRGASAPTLTFGAAATTITIAAAGVSVSNLHLVANFLDVASAFTIGAAKDFCCDSCRFIDTSAILNFLSAITTGSTANAADGLTVTNCYQFGLNTSPLAFISILGNLDRLYVCDNSVDSASTADVGSFLTIAALVIRGALIGRNTHNVVGATGASVAVFITGSSTTNTGMVFENYVTSLDTTAALLITAAINLAVHENYMSGVVAGSGTVFPAADAPS